jgi:hypothetical protein
MGLQLEKYYKDAEKIGGINAKVRLAMLSLIPSSKATSLPDSTENIQKLEKAMKQLKTELGAA